MILSKNKQGKHLIDGSNPSGIWKHTTLAILLLCLQITSCGPREFSRRTGNARGVVVMPDGTKVSMTASRGGYRANFDPNATSAQIMSIQDGPLSGVAIALPIGALSIPISINISAGSDVSGSTMMSTLGLKNSVAASGTPIEIQPSSAVDLINPMTLSIPLPKFTGLTAGAIDRTKLAVLYRVKVNTGSETGAFTGIVPAKELGLSGDNVLFESKYFGWFSVVQMAEPVTEGIKTKARFADQVSAKFFATMAELPACGDGDLYRIAYVAEQDKLYYCNESKTWVEVKDKDDGQSNDAIISQVKEGTNLISDGNKIGKITYIDFDSMMDEIDFDMVVRDSNGEAHFVSVSSLPYADIGISGEYVHAYSPSPPTIYFTEANCQITDTSSQYLPDSTDFGPYPHISRPLYAFNTSVTSNSGWLKFTPDPAIDAGVTNITVQSVLSGSTPTCTVASTLTTGDFLKLVKLNATMPIPFTTSWTIE
ncbi:MAG: hypothetical protein NT027_09925 [Proteobacteria bacterium]|nr:hypothetical protein [Pseudomonadota bacterium]